MMKQLECAEHVQCHSRVSDSQSPECGSPATSPLRATADVVVRRREVRDSMRCSAIGPPVGASTRRIARRGEQQQLVRGGHMVLCPLRKMMP